jgi:hypothetical protein
MYFDASDPAKVTPILTTQGIFTFTTPDGGMLGTVSANIVEGRAIRTTVEGYAKPLFRMVGFGPILRGTGQFEGADGMMVMNGATSVTPPGASKVYVFRFFDPQGKINAAWGETTSGV